MGINVANFKGAVQSFTLAATNSSQNTAVTQPPAVSGSAGNAGGYTDILVYNASAGVAFLNFGMAAATATTTSPDFVAPGAMQIINMNCPYTNVAIILSAGTGNVYFALGSGS